jgi:hypothetical protein
VESDSQIAACFRRRFRIPGGLQAFLQELVEKSVDVIAVAVRSRTCYAAARECRHMNLIAIEGKPYVRGSLGAGRVAEIRDESESRTIEVEPISLRRSPRTLAIAVMVFQLRVVTGTPKSRSNVPR